MQADKTCKFKSYTIMIILVLVFGIPIVACLTFCIISHFRTKNKKLDRRELINNPNRDDKPLETQIATSSKIPVTDNLGVIAPTASPYYFTKPEGAVFETARPVKLGVNIGEPVYEKVTVDPSSLVTPFIPTKPVQGQIKKQLPENKPAQIFIPLSNARL